VECYKQIKADLDVLRQSVEKSELWVYKSKSAEEVAKKKATEEEEEGAHDGENAPDHGDPKADTTIELEGPPLSPKQAAEYRKIHDVSHLRLLLLS